jgi:hypothetical protein
MAGEHDSLAEFKVHEIKELKRRDRRNEALDMLQKIARQVQPILRRRKWIVPVLREFMPTNPNLLVRTNLLITYPALVCV